MEDVWQPKLLTRKQMEDRRLFAKKYILDGHLSTNEIVKLCGVNRSSVNKWRVQLEKGNSLVSTICTGCPSRLTGEQVAWITSVLENAPDPQRYPDQRWTCVRVRELIGAEYGVWYNVDHVSKLLKKWGFSPQKPNKRAKEQNPEAVKNWIEDKIPELKKDRRRRNASVS